MVATISVVQVADRIARMSPLIVIDNGRCRVTNSTLKKLAKECRVLVESDNIFQRKVRILQSLWREEKGFEPGPRHEGSPDEILGPDDELGSRLPVNWAEQTLANYLTDTIRNVVREELDAAQRAATEQGEKGKVFKRPRVYNDLLSSQPLCFNLFAELQQDLGLATSVFQTLLPGRISEVTGISFEHNPRRSDPDFTDDQSAFDVFVDYSPPAAGKGFIGIEVKYHEDLSGKAAAHRNRYNKLAELMCCFDPHTLPRLREAPLQQIWRDHLLAGAFLADGTYTEGVFAFLYPAGNVRCRDGIGRYLDCLSITSSMRVWTLEEVVSVIMQQTPSSWIRMFQDRYLAFHRLFNALG